MVRSTNKYYVSRPWKNRRNWPLLIAEKLMEFYFTIFKMYGPFLTISQNIGTKNIFNLKLNICAVIFFVFFTLSEDSIKPSQSMFWNRLDRSGQKMVVSVVWSNQQTRFATNSVKICVNRLGLWLNRKPKNPSTVNHTGPWLNILKNSKCN
jgi:hypothetical protein